MVRSWLTKKKIKETVLLFAPLFLLGVVFLFISCGFQSPAVCCTWGVLTSWIAGFPLLRFKLILRHRLTHAYNFSLFSVIVAGGEDLFSCYMEPPSPIEHQVPHYVFYVWLEGYSLEPSDITESDNSHYSFGGALDCTSQLVDLLFWYIAHLISSGGGSLLGGCWKLRNQRC